MKFLEAKVREVMQQTVHTVQPDLPLEEALRRMHSDHISSLVVDMNCDAKGFGILTQKDVLGVLAEEDRLAGVLVSDVMTHPMVVLNPAYDLETAVRLMRMLGVRRAAVVDGARLCGMLSFTDIFRFACAAHLGKERKSA